MTLHDSKFQTVIFDQQRSIVGNFWKLETKEITEDEFRNEISKFEEIIAKNKPKGLVGVVVGLQYPVHVETQEWIAQNLFNTLKKVGVKKYAIVVSPDILTQLSVELTIEEDTTQAFETKYFDTEEDAKNWATS